MLKNIQKYIKVRMVSRLLRLKQIARRFSSLRPGRVGILLVRIQQMAFWERAAAFKLRLTTNWRISNSATRRPQTPGWQPTNAREIYFNPPARRILWKRRFSLFSGLTKQKRRGGEVEDNERCLGGWTASNEQTMEEASPVTAVTRHAILYTRCPAQAIHNRRTLQDN